MANQYINAMTALWNSAGTTYSAIKMNVTNAASAVGSMLFDLQVGSVSKFSVDKNGSLIAAGTVTAAGITTSNTLVPSGDDTIALGSPTHGWMDLYLASGAMINWAASDVTITHTPNFLAFAGAVNGYTFDANVRPVTNDGAALGTTSFAWSDLCLASGSVINWNAGDIALTHTAAADVAAVAVASLSNTNPAVCTVVPGDIGKFYNGMTVLVAGATGTGMTNANGSWVISNVNTPANTFTLVGANTSTGTAPQTSGVTADPPVISDLTIDGGDLRIATPGAASTSVVTISGQQTLTNKTLTSPTITGTGTIGAGPITSTGSITATSFFTSSTTAAVLAATGVGTIYLRPLGEGATSQQTTISSAGDMDVQGNINVAGGVVTSTYFRSTTAAASTVVIAANSGAIHLRPYGTSNATHEAYQTTDGGFRSSFFHATVGAGTPTYSFYNGNGPPGVGVHGMLIHGNGSQGAAAGVFILHPGHSVVAYLAFHQANVNLWGLYSQGPSISTGGWVNSDVKYKSQISDCDCHDSYDIVKAIKVRSYHKQNLNLSREGPNERGFLAHEIEAIIPEAVMDVPIPKGDAEGHPVESTESMKVVNDRTLLATLWAAVQHQAEMIEALQAQIEGK